MYSRDCNSYAPIISDVQEVPVKSLVAIAFLCVILAATSFAQSGQGRQVLEPNEEHTEWIASALRSIQAVKLG